MNPGRLPWAGMNDAFGVSTASAERPRVEWHVVKAIAYENHWAFEAFSKAK